MYNILTDDEVGRLFLLFKDRQNTFIEKVIKALPDLIYVMNLDTRVIIYSSRLIALEIGYSAKEVEAMSHPLIDIMHPEDQGRFLQHLQDVKNSSQGEVLSIEFRMIRHDGRIAWFIDRNTIFTRNLSGVATTKIGITHEITERKQYEEELIRHKKVIEQTEVLAGTGSWTYDWITKNFTWSAGMYKLFNLPFGSPVQPSVYTAFSMEDDLSVAERIVLGIEDAQFAFDEILHITVDGHTRALKIKGDPLAPGPSASRQMVGVDLDITSNEVKEKQLKKLNKELAAKNRDIQYLHSDLKTFADITATDYRTNFKNIYTSFETIITQEASKFSNSGKATLRKIQGLLQKMNLLTDDIQGYLTITKENTHTTAVSLDEVADHVTADLKDQYDSVDIVINSDQLGSIIGDRQLIYVLFRHLIDNAVKFRKKDPPAVIYLTSNSKELIQAEKASPRTKALLAICIEDNGIGFDPSEGEKIFEMFYKNHRDLKLRGSGLGLAVARKIMNVHNGFITSESTINEGSRFTCYFPAFISNK